MANPSPYLHIQDPRNGPVHSTVEGPPKTDTDDHDMFLQNGHQPDVNHAESYHAVSRNYGHWAQYRDTASYQGPPMPPPAASASAELDGQYPYHGSPDIDYPRNCQDNACGPHPPSPAHVIDIPNGAVRDCAPLLTDFANSFTQNVPDSTPSGTLAMESLKRLADRYLHDPGSRIETLRMGLSPSGGRLRVIIEFDMDV